MAREIERKFLVAGDGWRQNVVAVKSLRQAYLARTDRLSARVRIVDGTSATITLKSAQAGTTRSEYEYAIPVDDALELLELRQGTLIDKTRHIVAAGGLRWEIDVFAGALEGLIIAEIELPDAGTEIRRPVWLGREVTDDAAYYNANLSLGVPPRS
jgi:adenylate cyclase